MIYSLRLQNFRSYTEASYEFSPGVSIVVGPNASGKTNLLEAILLLCSGQSYRATTDELIAHGQPWARLAGFFEQDERVVFLERQSEHKAAKSFQINKQSYTRLSPKKRISVVLFEPQHLQMFQSGPEKRRDFLDNLLELVVPGYATTRRTYKRALVQRNHLLKRTQITPNELFAWNVRLAELGSQVASARQQLIESINQQLPLFYRTIARSNEQSLLVYQPSFAHETYSTAFLKKLETTLSRDREMGFTSSGPHREDFSVTINGQDARVSASRGEIRTILLSLKLVETKLLEDTTQQHPILLLDDVFSELDGARRKALTDFLKDYQTFITTTDADVVVQHFMGQCTIIPTQK